jgi:FG-GAP-like repeat
MRHLRYCLFILLFATSFAQAMGLIVEPSPTDCTTPTQATVPPAFTAKRLNQSQVAQGSKDIAWAWLGSPTARYPHKALGSAVHAATLHVKTANDQELAYTLPLHRVFEDLMVRLHDMDGDGRDEMIVIESDALRGSAIVVLGLRAGASGTAIVELARSPHTGGTFYWLNPVGVADFDGDGKLDIASVTTPHVGGILTLYRYAPPKLEPFAKAMDTSNHRMGDPEQNLAVIVQLPDLRPTVIVPDMSLTALHALRWEASTGPASTTGRWKELADVMAMPARVQRMTALPSGACVLLSDGTWRRVMLSQ